MENNDLSDLPRLSADLIKYLDSIYPEKCPDIKDLDREIWLYSGKRELINLLKYKYFEEEGD